MAACKLSSCGVAGHTVKANRHGVDLSVLSTGTVTCPCSTSWDMKLSQVITTDIRVLRSHCCPDPTALRQCPQCQVRGASWVISMSNETAIWPSQSCCSYPLKSVFLESAQM